MIIDHLIKQMICWVDRHPKLVDFIMSSFLYIGIAVIGVLTFVL